jgi:hypothetical protein
MEHALTEQRNSRSAKSHAFDQFELIHIIWYDIVSSFFRSLLPFFNQIAHLVRQDMWEIRQHMSENGRISSSSQVYLHETQGKRHGFVARGLGKVAMKETTHREYQRVLEKVTAHLLCLGVRSCSSILAAWRYY